MIEDPSCPVCANHAWERLSVRVFRKDDECTKWAARVRKRVLFELWQPNQEQVDVEFVLCQRCGFVTFRPRPTSEDVAAKYQFLDRLAQKRLAKDPVAHLGKPLDQIDVERSRELATALAPFVTTARPTALDFGGRSGALMTALVERDWRCGVVDYTSTTLPGIERLGNTLEDVPSQRRFDVVIASHVLEHVAEPHDTLMRLASRLTEDGFLFVEVPLEILGRVPQISDPVTHLNFFCEASLQVLFQRTGLEILSARHELCTFESGRTAIGARVIGRRARTPITIDYQLSLAQVRALLVSPLVLDVGDDALPLPEQSGDASNDFDAS